MSLSSLLGLLLEQVPKNVDVASELESKWLET